MISIFTPVSNLELWEKFLKDQLRDDLADIIEDFSLENLDHHNSVTIKTKMAMEDMMKAKEPKE